MIHVNFEGNTVDDIIRQAMEFVIDAAGRKVGFVGDDAPAAEAPKPKPEPVKPAPAYKLEDVRKACLTFRDKNGQAALSDVFAKLGAKKLPDIPEEKYGELMEMVKV